MDSYHIEGGETLEGEYRPKGAKNAVLPILAGTIISGRTSVIKNCPQLSDIRTMVSILKEMGCKITEKGRDIAVDSGTLKSPCIPQNLMKEIRSSVFLMGPTLARCGEVILSDPGGCAIGVRPIDIHLDALSRLGVDIIEENGLLKCTAKSMKGADIALKFPSVGATENIMMAALMAEGKTAIINPAKEPEIIDLQNYLISCGAHIKGAGSDVIEITGGLPLHETEYEPMPDRIEAGTILAAVAATRGKLTLRGAIPDHIESVINCLREAGCKIETETDAVHLETPKELRSVRPIETRPYPGFPTDMQSQIMALLCTVTGTTEITETIFENRFKQAYELIKMGADIKLNGRRAVIKGVPLLKGGTVTAEDLRGGASLVIAGLAAEGDTRVMNIGHVDRGYDRLENVLSALGANIKRMTL